MKRITIVGLCLIGLATLGLQSGAADRAAPESVLTEVWSYSSIEKGGVQPPPARRWSVDPSSPRAASFDGRPWSLDPVAPEGTAPISLASDDFDRDGVPDLLCGHSAAAGHVITLHRGNVDAIFPYGSAAQRRRIEGTFTDAPFLTPARSFEVGIRPDHLGVGDFDNDGTRDVVVGASGGTALHLLAGDGRGGLTEVGSFALPGPLTTMIAGEVNRPDGLVDLVVGVAGPEGPVVLVFEGPRGALRSEPESVALRSPAIDLALAPLATHAAIDLVIGTEHRLLVVRGRDRKTYLGAERSAEVDPPAVSHVDTPATVRAVATADFAAGSEGLEIVVLFDDGVVQLFDASSEDLVIVGERQAATLPVAPESLQSARISGSVTEDLVILDSVAARVVAVGGGTVIGDLDLEGSPIAALSMRLDPDALMDLVVLEEQGTLRVYRSSSRATITVDTALDVAVAGDGSCSLREAIGNANTDTDSTGGDCAAGSASDTILFNVGGGGSTIAIDVLSPLPDIVDSVTIDGFSQTCDGGPCVELRGNLAGSGVNGLTVTAGSSTLRGLNIQVFDADGIHLESAGNFVEGNFLGTDGKGTAAAGNIANGVQSLGADNTIGGTAPGAGNLVSANHAAGIRITGPDGATNVVQGNLVGTDVDGTADLGNWGNGIVAKWSPGNLIGGTSTAARNVVSGNNITGIRPNQPETVGNLVQGNFVGTNLWGNGAIGNENAGIAVVNGASDNTIGGPAAGARNLVSGNTWGVVAWMGATNNLVLGNYVGVDVSGNFALANLYNGIAFEDTDGNIAGGTFPVPANLVSGNGYHGVVALRANSNEILGNYIGTDPTGTVPIGNLQNGVHIQESSDNVVGGTLPGSSNVISGNGANGVLVWYPGSEGNEISGNYIGTDVTGALSLGNIGDGIEIAAAGFNTVGGALPGARNVISSNNRGVIIQREDGGGSVQARFNQVLGNYIGTDVTGTVDLGNVFHGVVVKGPYNTIGGTTPEARNVIAGNDGNGVWLREPASYGNQVLGNYIGVDASGSVALGNTGYAGVRLADGASDNTIGGTTPGARNIISGNTRGVLFDRVSTSGNTGNQVSGNFIGTDVSGTVDLGNDLDGVLIGEGTDNTIGGTAPGAANVISGNGTNGVAVVAMPATSTNNVLGNLIGTDVSGMVLLGNDEDGVIIENSADNAVGGTGTGAGNLIAGNGECGVVLSEIVPQTTYSNAILGNSIVSNIGMGIDHGDDGITTNDPGDPDPGPNLLQNFPVVTLADATPAGITIDGTLNSGATRQFRLEFFTSTECDASGCGEGERYLGFEDVMTDFGGNALFSVTLAAPVSDGDSITATATDSIDNTSEFADCFAATCQSFATLGQTIGAADEDTLVWAVASDVRFVKGDLTAVASYTFSGDGTLFGATSLDISVDHPDAGTGLYYLVRPLGCGSWQNVLGSEVGRDPALP